MISRRGFITSILALSAAPAIVRADSLMRVVPRKDGILRVPITLHVPQGAPNDYALSDSLSDSSLEQALVDMARFMQDPDRVIHIVPTKLLIHPSWYLRV